VQLNGDVVSRRRQAARYVGLFPRAWRERYGDELADLLENEPLGLRARFDLVRGALDARLHPPVPSPLPVAAALVASASAAAHAFVLATQPVPTDWPGYLDDALPLILLSVAAHERQRRCGASGLDALPEISGWPYRITLEGCVRGGVDLSERRVELVHELANFGKLAIDFAREQLHVGRHLDPA